MLDLPNLAVEIVELINDRRLYLGGIKYFACVLIYIAILEILRLVGDNAVLSLVYGTAEESGAASMPLSDGIMPAEFETEFTTSRCSAFK